MRSTVGIPLLPAQAVAEGQGGGGCQLPVELASGGRTKFNRCTLGLPKTHALDAACVGKMQAIQNWQQPTLTIKATGRGSYQRTRLNKFGFPRGYLMRTKRVHGFGTGDMVRAEGQSRHAHWTRSDLRQRLFQYSKPPKTANPSWCKASATSIAA